MEEITDKKTGWIFINIYPDLLVCRNAFCMIYLCQRRVEALLCQRMVFEETQNGFLKNHFEETDVHVITFVQSGKSKQLPENFDFDTKHF